MIRLLSIIFLSFLASCGPESIKQKVVTVAGATANPNAPAKWNNSSFPLAVKIANNFTAGEDGLIRDMASEWENTGNNDLNFFDLNDNTNTTANKDYSDLNNYLDSEMGIYKNTVWFSDVSATALAITQFWGYRENVGTTNEVIKLTHADIILNYKNYNFATDGSAFTYDLPSVILHEMGHFLGMYHSSTYSSIMYSSLSSGTLKRSTHSSDQQTLGQKYGVAGYTAQLKSVQNLSGDFSVDRPVSPQEGEFVAGRIELRAEGTCHHYENGVEVHVHPHSIGH